MLAVLVILSLNDKTKIVIFSQGKPQIANHNFKIGDKSIEVVKNFKYLGVTFECNGSFVNNINELKKQGNRAIFSVIKNPGKGTYPLTSNLNFLIRLFYQ